MIRRLLGLAFVAALTVTLSAQWKPVAYTDIPAFHAAPPAPGEKLPPLLSGKQLTGPYFSHPFQVRAYQLAAKIDKVLYQLPCYCYCDRNDGHKSLRSCYESDHAARCGTCMAEAFFAYQKTKAGSTPAQIRAAIERGEYKTINLDAAASMK